MTPTARGLDLIWTLLITLTLAGVVLGETAAPGLLVTVTVAAVTALKGRMVIDHFMEMGDAHPARSFATEPAYT